VQGVGVPRCFAQDVQIQRLRSIRSAVSMQADCTRQKGGLFGCRLFAWQRIMFRAAAVTVHLFSGGFCHCIRFFQRDEGSLGPKN
jgi:hypothetical protein